MRFLPYNKYRSKRTVVEGIKFHSQKEARRYQELRLLEQAGEIQNLKCQVKFPLWVEGELITTYIADFSYLEKGNYKVEDVKGMKSGAAYRIFTIKKNLLWSLHRIRVRET